ncbi:MAG TPA: glycoside hydrolase family 52 protein, partial [Armatimonadota bacterium]
GTLVGVGQGRRTAIATTAHGSVSGLGFTIEDVLVPRTPENRSSGLGPVAAIVITVPPGTRQTIRLAICFYREGIPTVGMDMRYLYTRYFANIDEVAAYALENFERYVQWAHEADALLMQSSLSADQQFMFAHATRSYYGSTELLEHEGRPFWVVNEGEYRMMNTFDLFVDQLFFEMRMNPWVVRNVLDSFLSRYSYHDQVHFPQSAVSYPGGLSFTHDMGVGNVFSRPGYSAYELYGLAGTFSHMTHEQLVNWVCCAGVYAAQTHDDAWLEQHLDVLGDCLQSLLRRDHPDPAQRNGMMGLDSSRSAAEITTYDSLDTSLGQARNNAYMAVKTWAAYILLARIFAKYGNHEDATLAEIQADRCARTIVSHVTGEGLIPAIMGEENESYIISAIEGLIFPYACGDLDAVSLAGRYGDLIHALREHIDRVLQRGVCLFPDGGWKLSSTSDNSWLSKIYLCQFVARAMLGIRDERSEAVADSAHVAWLLDPRNTYWGWSDQMIAGVATFSKYYPRGVTSVLWLDEAMWADTPVCALPSLSMIAGN